MKDWPRVAKLQSDMLAMLSHRPDHVASYMLTMSGLAAFRFGHTAARHHDYTTKRKAPARAREGHDPPRYSPLHVEEFAYRSRAKSIPKATIPCWTTQP
jgi:hypothetical protein